jgi:hypothetical protein
MVERAATGEAPSSPQPPEAGARRTRLYGASPVAPRTAEIDPKLPFTTTVANSQVGSCLYDSLLRKLTWSDIECAWGLV